MESPRGTPVGESPLSDTHSGGYGGEGLSIITELLCSLVITFIHEVGPKLEVMIQYYYYHHVGIKA